MQLCSAAMWALHWRLACNLQVAAITASCFSTQTLLTLCGHPRCLVSSLLACTVWLHLGTGIFTVAHAADVWTQKDLFHFETEQRCYLRLCTHFVWYWLHYIAVSYYARHTHCSQHGDVEEDRIILVCNVGSSSVRQTGAAIAPDL